MHKNAKNAVCKAKREISNAIYKYIYNRYIINILSEKSDTFVRSVQKTYEFFVNYLANYFNKSIDLAI